MPKLLTKFLYSENYLYPKHNFLSALTLVFGYELLTKDKRINRNSFLYRVISKNMKVYGVSRWRRIKINFKAPSLLAQRFFGLTFRLESFFFKGFLCLLLSLLETLGLWVIPTPLYSQNKIYENPAYRNFKNLNLDKKYETEIKDELSTDYSSELESSEDETNEGREERGGIFNYNQLMQLDKAQAPRLIKSYVFKTGSLRTGILFTYQSKGSKQVYLIGNFTKWDKKLLQRSKGGIFFLFWPIEAKNHSRIYQYKFEDHGIWVHDPLNPNLLEDGASSYLSLFQIEEDLLEPQATVSIQRKHPSPASALVEFSIYLPKSKKVSLVGSFNNWNPKHDVLKAERNGTFRAKLYLPRGDYVYKYIVDGKWLLDTYNKDTRFSKEIQELCSYISVP